MVYGGGKMIQDLIFVIGRVCRRKTMAADVQYSMSRPEDGYSSHVTPFRRGRYVQRNQVKYFKDDPKILNGAK